MVFSQDVKTKRHDITDCGGNLIITEDTGIAESTYYILNDDDFEINAWNEKDEYLEQYEEPKNICLLNMVKSIGLHQVLEMPSWLEQIIVL